MYSIPKSSPLVNFSSCLTRIYQADLLDARSNCASCMVEFVPTQGTEPFSARYGYLPHLSDRITSATRISAPQSLHYPGSANGDIRSLGSLRTVFTALRLSNVLLDLAASIIGPVGTTGGTNLPHPWSPTRLFPGAEGPLDIAPPPRSRQLQIVVEDVVLVSRFHGLGVAARLSIMASVGIFSVPDPSASAFAPNRLTRMWANPGASSPPYRVRFFCLT